MKKAIFSLLILISIPIFLTAQRATGLLSEDESYDALPAVQKKDGSKYPIKSKESLKPYCPVVGDQGLLSTCVGWATGYHAMTISKAIQDKITDKTKIERLAYSASYIYNHIKEHNECSKGVRLTTALSFLKQHGTSTAITFNNSATDCSYFPDSAAILEASKHRVKNFHSIFKSSAIDSTKIEETKFWLSRKKPIIIGVELTEDYHDINSNQKVWLPDVSAKTGELHAMVVVGYENKGTSGEFELLNSYGSNWGNDGFVKIKYEDYGQLVKYAYVLDSIGDFSENLLLDFVPTREIVAFGTAPDRPSFSSTVKLQQIKYSADNSYHFIQTAVAYNQEEQYYQPVELPWQQESQYQLIVNNLVAGRHLYVFSFTAKQEVISIWPSNNPLQKWKGLQQREVIVPWYTDALELPYSGRDYVVLLYSDRVITNFKKYLQQFREISGTFKARMEHVFGELLIDEKELIYQPDDMHFDSTTKEKVIPLVIAFDVE